MALIPQTYRWLYFDLKNLALLPFLCGVFYGCGQFVGTEWLAGPLGKSLLTLGTRIATISLPWSAGLKQLPAIASAS